MKEQAIAIIAIIGGSCLLMHGLQYATRQTGNFRITVYHPGGDRDVYDAVKYQPIDGHRANVWCRDGRELVVRGDFTVEEIK